MIYIVAHIRDNPGFWGTFKAHAGLSNNIEKHFWFFTTLLNFSLLLIYLSFEIVKQRIMLKVYFVKCSQFWGIFVKGWTCINHVC
jgi:hypothetical protein